MNKDFSNQSSVPMPKKYLSRWIDIVEKQLIKNKVKPSLKGKNLSIVFLNQHAAKSLNNKYRKKNYPTDVLSFSGFGDNIGELVLCPQVIKKQAVEHGLNFRQECAYLVLHGILHLLGYEHENNPAQAKRMFQLQDKIFEHIW